MILSGGVKMKINIAILDASGAVKAKASGEDNTTLVYHASYAEGDVITMCSDTAGYVAVQLEDSLQPAFCWLCGAYTLAVPFGEKRASYSPKCFSGEIHLLQARAAYAYEISSYRNLALNPFDNHQNKSLFPHARANVETRGESVFAARNAINGNTSSTGHGAWPYESWGINQQEDAEIHIDFGRKVQVDRLVITLRADFPHDNWWARATFRCSDGFDFTLRFKKTERPQNFNIDKRVISWLSMGQLIKDETNASLFPALKQLEVWGYCL